MQDWCVIDGREVWCALCGSHGVVDERARMYCGNKYCEWSEIEERLRNKGKNLILAPSSIVGRPKEEIHSMLKRLYDAEEAYKNGTGNKADYDELSKAMREFTHTIDSRRQKTFYRELAEFEDA